MNTIKSFLKQNYLFFIMSLPFLAMDFFIRILCKNVSYSNPKMIAANILFTVAWVGIFTAVPYFLKKIPARIVYTIFFLAGFVLFLTNEIYYGLTLYLFSFNLIFLAGEGSSYIADTIVNANPMIWVMCLVAISLYIVGMISIGKRGQKIEDADAMSDSENEIDSKKTSKYPVKDSKNDWLKLGISVLIFFVLILVAPLTLGKKSDSFDYASWSNPKNVYEDFNNAGKNMKLCGLYQYSARDIYVTFFRKEKNDEAAEIAFLDEEYSNLSTHTENDMTGVFEGKNLIILQLEGLDSWLLNEEDTPNLYALLNNSYVFSDHYSYYNGGGSTFNSEFAANTGYITPLSYKRNAYSFNTNTFKETLANHFKEAGYSVNAFHMNTGEYYLRGDNYKAWGYDEYHGLIDEYEYTDISYELDRELLENQGFYDKMFKQDGPFVDYIITYTPHTPFVTDKKIGRLVYQAKYGEDSEVVKWSEEESARLYAGETDYMIGLLMQALYDNGLMDNTVIVAYADHYLYTVNDKSILDKYKNTSNNLVNNTPFFIWSNDMERVDVDKTNGQEDVLPTILNMFGMSFYDNYYVGYDIFDESYTGYAFFSDYSWYDGNVYVEDGKVVSGSADSAYVDATNKKIMESLMRNDLSLKNNYFSTH